MGSILSAIRDDYADYQHFCSHHIEQALHFDQDWYTHWDKLKFKYNVHPRMKEREDHLKDDRFTPQD